MKYKGVIFDLDGTLINTLGDIAASMNKALELHGFPILPKEAYKDKVGWGIRRLAYLCIQYGGFNDTQENIEKKAALIAQDSIQFYSENPLVHSKAYPGIPELIATLKQRKIKTAVLTNKPDPTAQLVIAGIFPAGFFDCVKGEVFGRPRKPDPTCVWDLVVEMGLSPAENIFIGDSEIDMETAVSAGCFPLGVSWGYRSRETITKAGARHIIDRPEELLELI